jgi:hypothetical protein
MRRARLALVFLLLVPTLALAQSAKDSWNNLKKLARGQRIQVVLNDAKSYSGQFQSVSDNGLVFRVAGEEQTLQRQDILRVSTKGDSHRTRNALIGAGIGLGAGLGAGAGVAASRRSEYPQNRYFEVYGPILGAVFAAAGAGLGAAMPTGGWHDVYRAP